MNIVSWDPFRSWLDFSDLLQPSRVASEATERAWMPAVDAFERGDDLVIRAEIPGVEKDDIEVQVDDGTLVLSGERKRDAKLDQDRVYRLERAFGRFTRTFTLPEGLDTSRINAAYKNGILEVTLPKAESAKPRRIEVEAA